jgi:hypothetical protein
MNRKEKALVMGFVEYLQGVYGEGGTLSEQFVAPSNSLLIPMFVGGDEQPEDEMPDFGAVASVMGGGQPDIAGLLGQIDGAGLGGGMPAPGGMPMGGGMPMPGPDGMDPMAMMGMMG